MPVCFFSPFIPSKSSDEVTNHQPREEQMRSGRLYLKREARRINRGFNNWVRSKGMPGVMCWLKTHEPSRSSSARCSKYSFPNSTTTQLKVVCESYVPAGGNKWLREVNSIWPSQNCFHEVMGLGSGRLCLGWCHQGSPQYGTGALLVCSNRGSAPRAFERWNKDLRRCDG